MSVPILDNVPFLDLAELSITLTIEVKAGTWKRMAMYESSPTVLLKVGASTPNVPWPADGGLVQGPGKWTEPFHTKTLEKGQLITEQSFGGPALLRVSGNTFSGTKLRVDFLRLTHRDGGTLYVYDIPIELKGLPSLPDLSIHDTVPGNSMLTLK
jgi:hypothetical protein